ncbi:MAG: hypothetical protein P857_1018 [Candidatus Xenolissoclinum pacificiensis L6]|uniref:Uncharacterized protein n=1 Tax=Candidatus Xenolissoclinum pacificiensis L6 TaxID=1401685 RepID=W2V165_9RICK|nr:MAG: hypothetical protein P857_1018 [Candidatus Xenolissoclinum pacificiensis L6]
MLYEENHPLIKSIIGSETSDLRMDLIKKFSRIRGYMGK